MLVMIIGKLGRELMNLYNIGKTPVPSCGMVFLFIFKSRIILIHTNIYTYTLKLV